MPECRHNLVNVGAKVRAVAIWWALDPKAPSSSYHGPVPKGMGIGGAADDGTLLEIRVCLLCGKVEGLNLSGLDGLTSPARPPTRKKKKKVSAVLEVACPRCGAKAGEPCRKVYDRKPKGIQKGKAGDPTEGYFHSVRAALRHFPNGAKGGFRP